MSEFFKALEQAERDRVREEQAKAASTAEPRTVVAEGTVTSQTVEAEFATPASPVVVGDETIPPDVPGRQRDVSAPAAPAGVAAVSAPNPAATARAAAAPIDGRRAGDAPRPVTSPPAALTSETSGSSVLSAPSPASVFRRSLSAPSRVRPSGRAASRRQPRLVTQVDPGSLEADAYRTLRANIELMSDNGAYRHVAITSPAGGDGKSTTAANLAIVAAQGGRRVCLVDADLRRPTLHDVFGVQNIDGLAAALTHGRPLHEVAQSTDIDNLAVVVAGRGAQETFHDLFSSSRLEAVLRGSETLFDLVLFDSPPVVVSDTLSLAAICDGVIFVVRAGSIPVGTLQRAIGQVRQVKGRVLGILLNQVDPRTTDGSSYDYYRGHRATSSTR